MHRTATQQKIRNFKEQAAKLNREALTLDQVERMADQADEKRAAARQLRGLAQELKPRARLEDLTVYKVDVQKKLADGSFKGYPTWRASWRRGQKVVNKHLGSCAKMTQSQALEKARKLKARDLDLVI